jgi:hypothetical protein
VFADEAQGSDNIRLGLYDVWSHKAIISSTINTQQTREVDDKLEEGDLELCVVNSAFGAQSSVLAPALLNSILAA